MKVGIITFHWAVNYGAVLQAYALSSYLKTIGCKVEIIDYRPQWAKDVKPIPFPRSLRGCIAYIDELYKRRVFDKFRKKYLISSDDVYTTVSELSEIGSGYDVVITGSDQVFNPDIIASGGNLDKAFLLDFSIQKGRKIAYAASFGNSFLERTYEPIYKNILSEFDAVGIREKSGLEVLELLGAPSVSWTPDPTFLLDNYNELDISEPDGKEYIFKFMFQSSPESADCVDAILKLYRGVEVRQLISLKDRIRGVKGVRYPSPEKWISTIKNAQFVVTDSFHCTVFCILMHRPFISLAVNAWGTDWCERIKSLLERLGLSDRFIASYDDESIAQIIKTEIDWDKVDKNIMEWRADGRSFLQNYCNEAY